MTDGDMDTDVHERKKHQQEKVQKSETATRQTRPRKDGNGATETQGNSMGSGAQCIIVQRQAPRPCNIASQEQSDKKVRSWPGPFPRDRRRKYHWPAGGKKNSNKGFHMLCSKLSSILGTIDADEESLSITCSGKQESRGKRLRAKDTHDHTSREMHKRHGGPDEKSQR